MTSPFEALDEAETAARALLIAHSVAVILPNEINYPPRMLRLLSLLEDAIDTGDVILLPERVVKRRPDSYYNAAVEMLARDTTRADALMIAASMDACATFPNSLDLMITSRRQVAVIQDLVRVLDKTNDSSPFGSADRLRYLPNLLSLPLPNLHLHARELVAARRDGVFSVWRAALTVALRETNSLDDEELLDPKGTRLREIRDRLTDSAAESVDGLRRSNILHLAISGTVGVAVGCALGAIGASGGDELAALGRGVGPPVALLTDWLASGPKRRSEQRFRAMTIALLGS